MYNIGRNVRSAIFVETVKNSNGIAKTKLTTLGLSQDGKFVKNSSAPTPHGVIRHDLSILLSQYPVLQH